MERILVQSQGEAYLFLKYCESKGYKWRSGNTIFGINFKWSEHGRKTLFMLEENTILSYAKISEAAGTKFDFNSWWATQTNKLYIPPVQNPTINQKVLRGPYWCYDLQDRGSKFGIISKIESSTMVQVTWIAPEGEKLIQDYYEIDNLIPYPLELETENTRPGSNSKPPEAKNITVDRLPKLKIYDAVMFNAIKYQVQQDHLWCEGRDNDWIFAYLKLDKMEVTRQAYGYTVTEGNWPKFHTNDYAAATRAVQYLMRVALQHGMRCYYNGLEIQKAVVTTLPPNEIKMPVVPSDIGQIHASAPRHKNIIVSDGAMEKSPASPLKISYRDVIEWGDYRYMVNNSFLENKINTMDNSKIFRDPNLKFDQNVSKFCAFYYGYPPINRPGEKSWPEFEMKDYAAASRLVTAITVKVQQLGWPVKINGVLLPPVKNRGPVSEWMPCAGVQVGQLPSIIRSPMSPGQCIAGKKPKLCIATDNRCSAQPQCIHD